MRHLNPFNGKRLVRPFGTAFCTAFFLCNSVTVTAQEPAKKPYTIRPSLSPESGSVPEKPKSTGGISVSASASAFSHSQSMNAYGRSMAGATSSASVSVNQPSIDGIEDGTQVSRSTQESNGIKLTTTTVVDDTQSITIRENSKRGLEVKIQRLNREGTSGKRMETFKASSREQFTRKYPKVYAQIEPYLVGNFAVLDQPEAAATSAAEEQIEALINQNADNPVLKSALEQTRQQMRAAAGDRIELSE